MRSIILLSAFVFALAACGSDGDDTAATAPAAPTNLTAAPLSGGAHLTWTDNSDNEEMFMIMRMQMGVDSTYQNVAMVDFDTTSYHDAALTSGQTYMYMVQAMNEVGTSDSNEVEFTAP